jgi:hypothetical protein
MYTDPSGLYFYDAASGANQLADQIEREAMKYFVRNIANRPPDGGKETHIEFNLQDRLLLSNANFRNLGTQLRQGRMSSEERKIFRRTKRGLNLPLDILDIQGGFGELWEVKYVPRPAREEAQRKKSLSASFRACSRARFPPNSRGYAWRFAECSQGHQSSYKIHRIF